LRGDGIGSCEKKFTRTCVSFWMVTEVELFESTSTKTLWMTTKKDKLLIVHFTCFNLNLIFNVNFVTKKWQICYSWKSTFENSTSSLNAICNPCAKIWVDLHTSLYGLQHTKCERAIRLVSPLLFGKLRFSSTLTDKNLNR